MPVRVQKPSCCNTNGVQCDEQYPVCGGCKFRGRDCLYLVALRSPKPASSSCGSAHSAAQTTPTVDGISMPLRSSASSRISPTSTGSLFPDLLLADDNVTQFPESKQRRLLEIRLMTHVVQNMLVSPSLTDRWLAHWRDIIPKLAVRYDAVLYASCACSAGYLLQCPNSDDELETLRHARHGYMLLALREQRQLCDYIDETNAEAICLSASILLQATFTLMQDPVQDTLEAALEWVQMGKGVEMMLWKISAAVAPHVPDAFKIFQAAYQRVREQWHEEVALNEPFASAWAFICAKEHRTATREIYRRTLVYVGWIQRYADGGEPSVIVERRLQTFGVQSPAEFVDFLKARDPLALVVLAYLFGVMAQVEGHYWWLQPLRGVNVTVSSRLIQAIRKSVDASYHPILTWPLQQAKVHD